MSLKKNDYFYMWYWHIFENKMNVHLKKIWLIVEYNKKGRLLLFYYYDFCLNQHINSVHKFYVLATRIIIQLFFCFLRNGCYSVSPFPLRRPVNHYNIYLTFNKFMFQSVPLQDFSHKSMDHVFASTLSRKLPFVILSGNIFFSLLDIELI